jgi:DNA invertase Pin-like site-specific DNA recombinase
MDLTGKRAARLLRVSSRGQDEDNQSRPTEDYITANGMQLVKTYALRGKSARKGQQVAAVREAIKDAEAGEFDILVVRAIDRLDRRGRTAWLGTDR